MFWVMCVFFVSEFIYALRSINKAFAEVEAAKKYINKGLMQLQLAIFLIYLVLDSCYSCVENTGLYFKQDQDQGGEDVVLLCRLAKADFWILLFKSVDEIALLAVILMMTVRYTRKSCQQTRLESLISQPDDSCSYDAINLT